MGIILLSLLLVSGVQEPVARGQHICLEPGRAVNQPGAEIVDGALWLQELELGQARLVLRVDSTTARELHVDVPGHDTVVLGIYPSVDASYRRWRMQRSLLPVPEGLEIPICITVNTLPVGAELEGTLEIHAPVARRP